MSLSCFLRSHHGGHGCCIHWYDDVNLKIIVTFINSAVWPPVNPRKRPPQKDIGPTSFVCYTSFKHRLGIIDVFHTTIGGPFTSSYSVVKMKIHFTSKFPFILSLHSAKAHESICNILDGASSALGELWSMNKVMRSL